jgi:hypothetical protein
MIDFIERLLRDLERDGLDGKAAYWRGELEAMLLNQEVRKVCTVGDIRRGLNEYGDRVEIMLSASYVDDTVNAVELAKAEIVTLDTEDGFVPCLRVEIE